MAIRKIILSGVLTGSQQPTDRPPLIHPLATVLNYLLSLGAKVYDMSTNGDILKKKMLEAMTKTLGIVTKASELTGISRTTHYKWMESDPEYKAEIESIADIALDFAESKLFEKINGVTMGKVDKDGNLDVYDQAPSDTALIFYLKTKGKKRGYIERTEQVVEVGGNKIVFENASKRFDVQSNGEAVSKESE